MELITLTHENLEKEHICCALSNSNDIQVASKKAWLSERLEDGLVFKKGNVRGKCFIEYIPAEKAWAPIEADGYMYIDCLWVSGQFKGQGHSNLLLDACIADSREKGKKGLVLLSSAKKKPYLSDPQYIKHKGFAVADEAEPYFRLCYLPFDDSVAPPQFKDTVHAPNVPQTGFALYYAHQCPFTAKYVPLIEELARKNGVPLQAIRFQTTEEAQNAPTPFTSFSLFYNGKFVTHEILSEPKFKQLLAKASSGGTVL